MLASEVPSRQFFGYEADGVEYHPVTITDLTQGAQRMILGIMPFSHELIMTRVWTILVEEIASLTFRNRRSRLFLGLMMLSHWLLDFIMHSPDLPLLFGGASMVGLGIWSPDNCLGISGILEIIPLSGGL